MAHVMYQERRVVFKTIVWATDGSPSALNALTVAKRLAREADAKLVIVHAKEAFIGNSGILLDSDEELLRALQHTAERLHGEGIDAELAVGRAAAGGTARVIVDQAAESGADLIVLGNRGHGLVTGLFLGSVATRVLQTAPVPVLMVPAQAPERG
jgi:nucleotide-binding universal stress UspA family protein